MKTGRMSGGLADDVSEMECRRGIISMGEMQFLLANG